MTDAMRTTAAPKLRLGALRAAPPAELGSIVDGKYRVESVIGRGGMGVVVAARHVQLGHRVAIKLLRAEVVSEGAARRLLREARAAAMLTSDHVTRVHDVGSLDGGTPFIVMELLEGSNLAQILDERGPLGVEEAATYVVQACDAIAEAHAQGVVHRDLKPSNLFVTHTRDGTPHVKLMDFGVSRIARAEVTETQTATNDSVGTPRYMSPEQLLSSKHVDWRTDIWALGVILYRLLTNKPPFDGETTPAIYLRMTSGPAPHVRDKRFNVPAIIDDLVARCLMTDRNERPQAVDDIASTLLPFADENTRRRLSGRAHAPAARARRWRSPVLGIAVGLACVAAVALAAWRLEARRAQPPQGTRDVRAPHDAPAPVVSAPATVPSLSATRSGPEPETAAPPASRAATPTSTTLPRASPSAARAAAATSPVSSKAPIPPPRDACDPPFTYQHGVKYPKLECL